VFDAMFDRSVNKGNSLLILGHLARRGDEKDSIDGTLGLGREDGLWLGDVALHEVDKALVALSQ